MNRRASSDMLSLSDSKSKSDPDQIYPGGGSASGRRNRLRGASSSVFPVGCMGTPEVPEELREESEPREEIVEKILQEKETLKEMNSGLQLEAGDIDPIPDLPTPKARSVRNPLTGEGMESSDMPRYPIQRKNREQTKFLY